MDKRTTSLCLSLLLACSLALHGCGIPAQGDTMKAAATSTQEAPTIVGEWKLASAEVDDLTVVGDLSSLVGSNGDMTVVLDEDGTGRAVAGGTSVDLAWSTGDDGSTVIQKSDAAADKTDKTDDKAATSEDEKKSDEAQSKENDKANDNSVANTPGVEPEKTEITKSTKTTIPSVNNGEKKSEDAKSDDAKADDKTDAAKTDTKNTDTSAKTDSSKDQSTSKTTTSKQNTSKTTDDAAKKTTSKSTNTTKKTDGTQKTGTSKTTNDAAKKTTSKSTNTTKNTDTSKTTTNKQNTSKTTDDSTKKTTSKSTNTTNKTNNTQKTDDTKQTEQKSDDTKQTNSTSNQKTDSSDKTDDSKKADGADSQKTDSAQKTDASSQKNTSKTTSSTSSNNKTTTLRKTNNQKRQKRVTFVSKVFGNADGVTASLSGEELVLDVASTGFTGKLTLTKDGTLDYMMPESFNSLEDPLTEDELIGTWDLTCVTMSGKTYYGKASDLIDAVGMTMSPSLTFDKKGQVAGFKRDLPWVIDESGAYIRYGKKTKLPVRCTVDGVAVDVSELLGGEVILFYA